MRSVGIIKFIRPQLLFLYATTIAYSLPLKVWHTLLFLFFDASSLLVPCYYYYPTLFPFHMPNSTTNCWIQLCTTFALILNTCVLSVILHVSTNPSHSASFGWDNNHYSTKRIVHIEIKQHEHTPDIKQTKVRRIKKE